MIVWSPSPPDWPPGLVICLSKARVNAFSTDNEHWTQKLTLERGLTLPHFQLCPYASPRSTQLARHLSPAPQPTGHMAGDN